MSILVEIILGFLARILSRLPIVYNYAVKIVTEYAAKNKTVVIAAVTTFITDLLHWIADNVDIDDIKHPKEAVLRFLLERCDLELEGFSKEDMKKAAGKLIAKKVNEKYGTAFTSFYPLDTFKAEINRQIVAELTSNERFILNQADVVMFKNAVITALDANVVGLLPAKGVKIQGVINAKIAYRRQYGRERSRKFALTHKRTYGKWVLK
jgi:phosphatidylserine/phosphatidylglycerophosphate/cardiolipin synthase-like enzyme